MLQLVFNANLLGFLKKGKKKKIFEKITKKRERRNRGEERKKANKWVWSGGVEAVRRRRNNGWNIRTMFL